jgi:hypothetical protein
VLILILAGVGRFQSGGSWRSGARRTPWRPRRFIACRSGRVLAVGRAPDVDLPVLHSRSRSAASGNVCGGGGDLRWCWLSRLRRGRRRRLLRSGSTSPRPTGSLPDLVRQPGSNLRARCRTFSGIAPAACWLVAARSSACWPAGRACVVEASAHEAKARLLSVTALYDLLYSGDPKAWLPAGTPQ